MNTLRFYLFGKLHVETNGRLVQKIEPRKAEELLAFLLLHRDQPQSREHLADILWGELEPEQSKAYLRKALWQLQSILDSQGGKGIILVDGEWLQINPHGNFWLDVKNLDDSFRSIQGMRGKDLHAEQVNSLQQAVSLYRGDLLGGWYQDWCLYERERLQHLYLAMLDKLMDHCETHENFENGVILGEKILQYDRARERTHRRLMRLFYRGGDRTAALRQYQKCVAALREELDVGPAERTRLLYENIRADWLGTLEQAEGAGKYRSGDGHEEPLDILFSHLNTFQRSLSQIQSQIAQDIQIIQKTKRKPES